MLSGERDLQIFYRWHLSPASEKKLQIPERLDFRIEDGIVIRKLFRQKKELLAPTRCPTSAIRMKVGEVRKIGIHEKSKRKHEKSTETPFEGAFEQSTWMLLASANSAKLPHENGQLARLIEVRFLCYYVIGSIHVGGNHFITHS